MGNLAEISDMFAHAATGFAITEAGGRLVKANRALGTILDRTDQQMLDINLFDLTHPGDQIQVRDLLDRLLADEIPGFVVEKRYMRPSGEPVWVRNSVTITGKDQSDTRHFIHTCEDLSQRKNAERVLEQQEQMAAIGRLTSSIVHEINNPLEAIFNLVYLAQHSPDLEGAKLHLQDVQEELRRISEITTQSLQFHRQSSAIASVNIVSLLQTVLTLFKARLRSSAVQVTFGPQAPLELVCCAGEVRQVFVNLLDNAVEAMPDGGELRIRVRPGTDWRTGKRGVRVTIADTGLGMSEQVRKHIYDAFYTTKGAQGSGLGLWVTAGIVRKHNGHMHVRSRCLRGSGTVFTILFPYSGAGNKAAGLQDAAA